MWNIGACPKCKGNLFLDEDGKKCLQCGWAGGQTLERPKPVVRLDMRSKEAHKLFPEKIIHRYYPHKENPWRKFV